MKRIPSSDADQVFVSIRLSYDNTRIFTLESGMQFLASLSKSTHFNPENRTYDRDERSYDITFWHLPELNEKLVDRLLNGERDSDGNVIESVQDAA